MPLLVCFIVGLMFSVGLAVSGMVNPSKVLGFLDVFGEWDASLAFVMGGAVVFNFVAFRIILRRPSPLLQAKFTLPVEHLRDRKLVMGSVLFGIGWGLFGVCPGPGVVNLFLLDPKILSFVASMVIGMVAYRKFAN